MGYLTFQQTKVWKDGIALFNNCVQKTPEASLCQCNLAYSELLNLDFQNSIDHYSEALKYDPNTVEAYNGRGQAYFQLKKIPEALSDFSVQRHRRGHRDAKTIPEPGQVPGHVEPPARSPARPEPSSLELEPRSPEAFFFRAVVFEKRRSPPKRWMTTAKRSNWSRNIWRPGLTGLPVVGLQQYGPAIDDYTRAIQLILNMEMIFNNRGYAHLKNGEPDQALADVNKALEINPNYAKSYQTRAVIYQQLGQTDKMQADLQMV